ncbi:MAG: DNA replication/repair protein RecF [Firmicutes bacterium]|nr:DNA replication/repair protein RecF [Bacillota bacterium]
MRLTRVVLRDFRNWNSLQWQPPPGPLWLVGENGQGKSNLLEAIALPAQLRSIRGATDREMIRFGASQAEIFLAFEEKGEHHEVGLRLQPGGRQMHKDGRPQHKASALVGFLRVVPFQPEDIALVAGPPALRRRWLDVLLSELSQPYLQQRSAYEHALRQRNALLRQGSYKTLAGWDEALSDAGAAVTIARLSVVVQLTGLLQQLYQMLSGEKSQILVRYRSSWLSPSTVPPPFLEARGELQEGLRQTAALERQREVTLVGPQRDDVALLVDGHEGRRHASRGQQRLLALCLRLAEAKLLAERYQDPPILLLDDLYSELDEVRQRRVSAFIQRFEQALMTTTQHAVAEKGTVFFVKSGTLHSLGDG